MAWRYSSAMALRAMAGDSPHRRPSPVGPRDPDRVFSRKEIMQHLWDSSYVGDQRACDIHISNLRRKVEADPSEPKRIVTVRGIGYKLVAV